MVKRISLEMVHDHLDHFPYFLCPSDYTIRTFVRGDERLWARIETEAGEFVSREQALERFQAEFGPFLREMEDRCYLLEDRHGEAIGTATAWSGYFAGEKRGRVHWVGIVPSYQGKKLSKTLLSAVMARLAKEYQKGYLTTQTTSYQAVNLYLNFGFVPFLGSDVSREGWLLMEQVLQRKIL
jgi:ribosomal protein S18 acetylase RimI-like enzyme